MKTFFEIGTCDFDHLRRLCDKGWRGIMAEPHKPFLDSISDHENLIKINKAIDLQVGTTSYSRIRDDSRFITKNSIEEATDYRGMGTIYSGNVLHVDTASYAGELETYDVPTTTFNEVMEELGYTTIDYLKIDIEGWDFQILKSIDFEKYKINIIKMETGYCDPYEVADMLDDLGYHIEFFENDIIAIKN